MVVDHVFKWENQGLQRGSLDFSDYWFPSPVRQGDRSVGFRHGGHSLHPPFWLARCLTVGQTLTDWRLTDQPELFSFSVLLFILAFLITCSRTSVLLPFWVILDFTKCPPAWVQNSMSFQEVSLEAAEGWDVEKKKSTEGAVERKELQQQGKKRRKGHFYLGEHHLNKLQRPAIKKLKLPNCWVTTATKSLIKAVSRAAVDRKWGEAPWEEMTEGEESSGEREEAAVKMGL